MLDEHAHAFTVAKSAGFDVLRDIHEALAKAIEERQDFSEFQKGLEPLLRAKGWWGKAPAIDPLTGKEKLVQLGSPRRLKTIYWANVNTAYAAGEWERTWRTRRVLPYLEYLISTAEHKRLEHLAWVGTVLPVEDRLVGHALSAQRLELPVPRAPALGPRGQDASALRRHARGLWRARLRELAHRRGDARAQRHRRRLEQQSGKIPHADGGGFAGRQDRPDGPGGPAHRRRRSDGLEAVRSYRQGRL